MLSSDNNDSNTDVNNDMDNNNDNHYGDSDEYSIHDRLEQIYVETDTDRKTEIRERIKYGDSLTKIALSVAFWGFWIFWIIVALM